MHCWYIHTSSSLRGAGETPRRIETSFSFDFYPSVLECVSKPINVWKIRCACAQWIALQKVSKKRCKCCCLPNDARYYDSRSYFHFHRFGRGTVGGNWCRGNMFEITCSLLTDDSKNTDQLFLKVVFYIYNQYFMDNYYWH